MSTDQPHAHGEHHHDQPHIEWRPVALKLRHRVSLIVADYEMQIAMRESRIDQCEGEIVTLSKMVQSLTDRLEAKEAAEREAELPVVEPPEVRH